MIKSYRELIVWQKSYRLVLEIYRVTKELPREELYGLVAQMRAATIAIPSNIAEGYSRQYRREYLQFLYISFSSGAELETQLLLSLDLGYISRPDFDKVSSLLEEVMKMLNNLINQLKKS